MISNQQSEQDSRSKASSPEGFVTRAGTKFYLNGQVFTFVGFNLFDAAGASANSPYSCLGTNKWFPKFTEQELDLSLKQMKEMAGATVLRFWAFQKYTNGGTDFSGIDTVIKLAKANGFKVLPVLEDGPGYCTEPGGGGNGHIEKWKYQGDTWYTEGYKIPNAPYTLSYRDYVKTIVTRYKDEPTILGWMMVNEADTSKKVDGKSPLVAFAKDIGGLMKSIDPHHLITVGTQSNGASGGTGQDFLDVYGLDIIDFTEGHDWGYWGNDAEAIPGGIKNSNGTMSLPNPLSPDCLKTYQAKIGCSLAQSVLLLKKPYVMGEAGIAAADNVSRDRRAKLMDQKMGAFFSNGGAGYVYWQWNHVVDSQQYDVLPNTNDPLLAVMKKYSGFEIDALPLPTSTIIPIPTSTLKPTATKTPTPTKPTAISPQPSATPTKPPTGVSAKLEGENMSGTGQIITEQNGTKSLLMAINGTAKGQLSGPIKRLTIKTKADLCQGYPHINVKIDGNFVLDQNVMSTTYTDYQSINFSFMNLKDSLHTIEVIYNNDTQTQTCNKNVYIDSITGQTQ